MYGRFWITWTGPLLVSSLGYKSRTDLLGWSIGAVRPESTLNFCLTSQAVLNPLAYHSFRWLTSIALNHFCHMHYGRPCLDGSLFSFKQMGLLIAHIMLNFYSCALSADEGIFVTNQNPCTFGKWGGKNEECIVAYIGTMTFCDCEIDLKCTEAEKQT